MEQLQLYLHDSTEIFEIQTLAMKLTRICREMKLPRHKLQYAKRQVQKCLSIIKDEPNDNIQEQPQ